MTAIVAVLAEIMWGLVILAWIHWGLLAIQHPIYTLPLLRIVGWLVWLIGLLWLYNLTPAALEILGQ